MTKIPAYQLKRLVLDKTKFQIAEKITRWNGALYLDYLEKGYGEGYFKSLECLSTSLLDLVAYEVLELNALPKFAWTCEKEHMSLPSALQILEFATQHLELNIGCDSDKLEKLAAPLSLEKLGLALLEFDEANKHIYTYVPNFKKALLLDWDTLRARYRKS